MSLRCHWRNFRMVLAFSLLIQRLHTVQNSFQVCLAVAAAFAPVEDGTKLYLNATGSGSPSQQEEYQRVLYRVQSTSLCLLITRVTLHTAKWCRPILCRISSSLCVSNWNSQCQACSALLDILSSTASLSPLHAPKQSVAPLFHKNTMGLRAAFPYRGMQYVAILSSLRTATFSSIIMSS